MSAYTQEPPRLARGMAKRFLLGAAVIVFLTAAASATAVLLQVDTAVNAFNRFNQPIAGVQEVLDDVPAGRPQTILILGSDRRWGDREAGIKPRSDTIILVRLDPTQDATAILSIPRDLKVTYHGKNGTYSDKINAAYEIGGPRATVRKVKEVMGGDFPIHHVVNVNFGAFTRAVDKLGCFYIDVDRRYFNDNRPPVASPTKYATIDLHPGYQRLCGRDSLDFVRFRHLDTDIVRGARQQHYLSEAKDQLGVDRLFRDRNRLLELFGRYTDTDIKSSSAVLRLLKLTYESSRNPLRRVRFRARLGESFVTISKENLRKTRDEFLAVQASEGATGRTRKRPARPEPRSRPSRDSAAPGLELTPRKVEDDAVVATTKLPFPVYYPRYILKGARHWDGHSRNVPRTYDLYDQQRRKRRAYRMVVEAPGMGEYYGIQGTNWLAAPLVENPSETRVVNGRKLMLFNDGSRLRLVAWRTPRALYWVSNTLLRSLTNAQMLAIARSLTRPGASG